METCGCNCCGHTEAQEASGKTRLIAAAVAAVLAECLDLAGYGTHWGVAVLALAAIAGSGLETWQQGWMALRQGTMNMKTLIAVAVTGAMCIGHWPEAAMVMVLLNLAEHIEEKSLERARHAIRQLLTLVPETATVQQEDGQWREVAANTVRPSARVRVRPGERIALDGVVLCGRSTVNQAPITGESLPVDKAEEIVSLPGRSTRPVPSNFLSNHLPIIPRWRGSFSPSNQHGDDGHRHNVLSTALRKSTHPPYSSSPCWSPFCRR